MGAMMARLQEASSDFRPSAGFTRPSWGSRSKFFLAQFFLSTSFTY
ncbi:MAG: hypothetical protein ACQEXQ_17735 [Bacillota bacterium]